MTDVTGATPRLRSGSLEVKRRQLQVNRRRATGCLVVVTLVFLAATFLGGDSGWAGYLKATAEASMVGGLADWFAVTALFRHPLGIPIPHTAVVPERKEQFAATLGEFVQESFLTPEVIAERVAAAGLSSRLARWLSHPANAARVATLIADVGVAAADVVEDESVHQLVDDVLEHMLEVTPLAPLAGRALAVAMEGGHHQAMLDSALRAVDRYLAEHQDDLRRRLAVQSPWWLPDAVEERAVRRLVGKVHRLISDIAADPAHDLRRHLDLRLRQLATDLQTSPELRNKVQRLARELLAEPAGSGGKAQPAGAGAKAPPNGFGGWTPPPGAATTAPPAAAGGRDELRAWVASVWTGLKADVRAQAASAESPLRRRLATAVTAAGARLQSDPLLAARLDDGAVAGARYAAEHLGDEVAALITTTIGRWDAEETSDRLELLLGPDLQLIRINGTIVGGMAGLTLYAFSQVVG